MKATIITDRIAQIFCAVEVLYDFTTGLRYIVYVILKLTFEMLTTSESLYHFSGNIFYTVIEMEIFGTFRRDKPLKYIIAFFHYIRATLAP